MRADELKALLDRRPFKPIRIQMSSGEHVDVTHPEMAMLARSTFVVAMKPVRGVADYFGWYSLIHVVKVVPLRNVKRTSQRRKRRA